MTTEQSSLAFGPVPSRRLGRSLGINNIPPKSCSYSCLYCQVGKTVEREIEPRSFYPPAEIQRAVLAQVEATRQAGEAIDYLTFVPDGEPTLDLHLGETIDLLRPLGIRIAVISNASLLWREEVRQQLCKADWVSLKVDSVDETIWREINRPHPSLCLADVLAGIKMFVHQFQGELCTETMLVEGVNTGQVSVAAVAQFLEALKPHKAYLAIPTRPPAETDISIPNEEQVISAYQILHEHVQTLEYLIGYEGNAFASSGNAEQDLLSITAVHPMREEAVRQLLDKGGADWNVVQQLLAQGKLKQVEFAGNTFYVRCLQSIERQRGQSSPG